MVTSLFVQGSCILDASGYGVVELTPRTNEQWHLDLMSISVTKDGSTLAESRFDLYQDLISELNWLEGSYSGNRDQSNTTHYIEAGQTLIGVWSDGTPGSTAVMKARRLIGIQ